MPRLAWLALSGCFWAVMMFLLFEREIRPYFEYRQPPSYRTMLRRKTEPEMERRSIWFGRERVGESERLMEPLAGGGYRLRSRVSMDMKLMMPATLLPDTRTRLASEVLVDGDFRLSRFGVEGGLPGLNLNIRGSREGDKLKVVYDLMLMAGEQVVDFPRDATLADYFMPYEGGASLAVGKKWKSRMLDLDNLVSLKGKGELAFTEVYAVVVDREVVRNRGRDVYAFKVEVRKEPTQPMPSYTLWVDDQGTVVKQEMKINKLACVILLEECRTLAPREAGDYPWRVPPPR